MSTSVDRPGFRRTAEGRNGATPPSTAPEPAPGPDHCEKGAADSGSLWLQEEIARRIAAKSSGSGGRHARRDNPDPSTVAGYGTNGATGIPRHATATPGPAAVAPEPYNAHRPPKLPRRGPAGANGDTEAWTGPDRSREGRPVVGGPSLPGSGAPARRPSGAAAARLLSPPPSPPPAPAVPARPVVATPGVDVDPAASATGDWPAPPGTPSGYADPGPLTGPVRDAPVADPPDEILWSSTAMPPARAPVDLSPAGPTRPPGPVPLGPVPLGPVSLGPVAVPEQRGDPTGGYPTDRGELGDLANHHHGTGPGRLTDRGELGTEGPRGARFPRGDGTGPESPKRVRVVLAERKGVARPVRTVVDIQEATAVGELLRSDLIGSQLTMALRFAAGAGLTLGILPLLFALFPAIGEFDVLGFRLPWLLLGFLVYPFLFGLGWWHTRTAERVEQNFADHVQE